MQVRLILLSGSRVGDEVQVDGEAILGRSPDCALCLEDGGVSRQHAKVRLEADSICTHREAHRWMAEVHGVSVDSIKRALKRTEPGSQ